MGSNDTRLSGGEKCIVWVCMIFLPVILVAIVEAIIYSSMKEKNPQKAADLNRTTWIAFFVCLAIKLVLCALSGFRYF